MSTGSNDATEKSTNLQIVQEQSTKEILETFKKWFVEKFKNSPASNVVSIYDVMDISLFVYANEHVG